MQPKHRQWHKWSHKELRFLATINDAGGHPQFDVYVARDLSFWCYYNGQTMWDYTNFTNRGNSFAEWFWKRVKPVLERCTDPSISPHAS